MGAREHREEAELEAPARLVILTVSDTRTERDDESGRLALEILQKYGHEVVDHRLVPNVPSKIRSALVRAFRKADLVVTLGGTGPGAKDVTIEAVRPLLAKELPGFGEQFRAESRAEIGGAAMLSRALLGVTRSGQAVVCTPGSPGAVRLALEGILMNELKHLLRELRRGR